MKTEELKLVTTWDNTFPKSEKVEPQEDYIYESIWNYSCSRYVYSEECRRFHFRQLQ